MKISFDLDGTTTEHPDLLIELAKVLKGSGHEVGVLTGRVPEHIPDYGFKWDFKIGWDGEMGASHNFTPEEKARLWKPKKLRENKIDICFDDLADEIGEVEGCKVVRII